MEKLLQRLGISVDHLKCLDETFRENSEIYRQIDQKMRDELGDAYTEISREVYAGGKSPTNSRTKLSRQMILGDVIEYIFTGRAYYYAAQSEDRFKNFMKLVLYAVDLILLFDTITVNPVIRRQLIEKLEDKIDPAILYEKQGDKELAEELKQSEVVIFTDEWEKYDQLIDSLLPKTLGLPKELIVFIELIRLKIGLVVPLLLIQRLFGGSSPIAPPDFLVLKKNKEIFGIEVGYEKEGQSREFSLRTSIPTFAIDLRNHMHNRCPNCGENILYCEFVVSKYADGTLWNELDENGKYSCSNCPKFNDGRCPFSNYYGRYEGPTFHGAQQEGNAKKDLHYHAKCVREGGYTFNRHPRSIRDHHMDDFFAQIPEIEGIESIL